MKIVNINEYNENDGLKRKLRQRMDAYEPELSGSVWDRIQHEMDERDANRKKRFLWWISSVAMVVLAGSIIGFLVFGGESQNNQTAQNTPAQTQVNSGENNAPSTASAPISSENINSVTEAASTVSTPNSTNSSNSSAVSTNPTTSAPNTHRPSTNNNGGGAITDGDNTQQNNNSAPVTPSTNSNDGEENQTHTAKPIEGVNIIPAEEAEKPVIIGENLKEQEGGSKEDNVEESKPTTSPVPTSTTESEKKQRWFVGLAFGYNQTFRTVSDIQNTIIVYPKASDRNKFEQKSYSPSYGFEFGFYPVKNFFIKSGVSMYQTSEQVRYDIWKKKITAVAVYYGDPSDSVAVGSTTHHKNTYNYVQIPLEIGYSRQVYKRLGIMVSGGIAYNMLKNYSYYVYEPNYGNAFVPPTAAEASLYDNMYKSYYMLSGSIGMQYSIGKYWVANLGINYRKAITNAADEKYEVDIRPYSVGINTGLALKF